MLTHIWSLLMHPNLLLRIICQRKKKTMKGVVFTEFLEMVDQAYGFEMTESLISECELPSGGVYTAVGTYDHSEIVQLVKKLSEKTETSIPDLLKTYGKYLFGTFKKGYPAFINAAQNAFDFLESIEKYIHVEVRKLYPDAELPTFETSRPNEKTLRMIYHSERKMSSFAEGLIEASLLHFEEDATVVKEVMENDGSIVAFTITKV